MNTRIVGIGTAVPEFTMSQDESVAMATDLICRSQREARLVQVMYRKSNVQTRHTCVPHRMAYQWIDQDAPPSSSAGPTTQERMSLYADLARPLALAAATRALQSAGVDADQITHLVTVSCTGFDAPGVDIHLFDELGLPATTQRLHIGFMGCHGAINGLRAARGLVAADPNAKVLVCAVELCSLHFKFQWDPELMLGNALFSDGAAALVLASQTSAAGEVCQLRDTGSCLLPESREAITWNIGDYGFDMSLSNQVAGLIGEQLKPWLENWLLQRGYSIQSIKSWAVHPGGPRILDAVTDALGIDPSQLATSRSVLAEHGNMSSPTVLFILERFLQQETPCPCVMLGFGPGLVAEVALLE